MMEPPLLIDASRLIWRVWSGRLPTGIDKVCLAYLKHYGAMAQAVVQRGDRRMVLSPRDSQALFGLLQEPGLNFRRRLIAAAPKAILRQRKPLRGQIYLNIGHTGLNAPGLIAWTVRTGIRPVYLIHDLIPITHPQFCRDGEAARHETRMTNALASAAGIIANSQATLDDLLQFAVSKGMTMPDSTVSWLAGHDFGPDVRPAAFDRPYFITVGTIEGRKNHLMLLKVWQRLIASMGKTAPLLVIVGQRGWSAQAAFDLLDNDSDLRSHVKELGSCSDADMGQLIAGARALLMPSHAEGFGLPVVEALQLRAPVIANDLPVYHEIAGALPTYLPSDDDVAWEAAIVQFTSNCADRERQLAVNSRYDAPNWSAHFNQVTRFLDKIARDPA
jgi:glycosyltransferase involved in cell wall biosynthesis